MTEWYGSTQKTAMETTITKNGQWKIDHVFGKAIVNIKIFDLENKRYHLSYAPTHPEIDEIIDKACQAELENDLFEFKNGKLGVHRNSELFKKIAKCQFVLDKWRLEGQKKLGFDQPPMRFLE